MLPFLVLGLHYPVPDSKNPPTRFAPATSQSTVSDRSTKSNPPSTGAPTTTKPSVKVEVKSQASPLSKVPIVFATLATTENVTHLSILQITAYKALLAYHCAVSASLKRKVKWRKSKGRLIGFTIMLRIGHHEQRKEVLRRKLREHREESDEGGV